RRRDTRLVSDWSSDVCSSDLAARVEIEMIRIALAVELRIVGRLDPDAARHVQDVANPDLLARIARRLPFGNRGRLIERVDALLRSEERRVGKKGESRRAREQW